MPIKLMQIDHNNPCVSALAIDISAADHDLSDNPSRKFYVGVAGDVKATLFSDSDPVVFKAMPVGVHDIAVKKVIKVGTTATNMVALW